MRPWLPATGPPTFPTGWDFAGIANGGLVMAQMAAVLGPTTGHPDPVSLTGHYIAPAASGPIEIEGEVLRSGRRLGTATGRLLQAGKVVALMVGTFGDLATRREGVVYEMGRPELPPVEDCVAGRSTEHFTAPGIFDKVGMRFHPDHLGFAGGQPPDGAETVGRAEIAGWMRLQDGRPPDPLAALLLADAHPPSVFNAPGVGLGWVPTIEMTVHLHKRPVPGWIGGWFTTQHISGGFLEEDGVLWDEEGDLIAVARQIALVPR